MPDRGQRGPPWMQEGGPDWGPGARVFRRILGLVVFLILLGPVVGFALTRVFGSTHGPRRWISSGLAVLVVLAIVFIVRRGFGRTWRPVGALIDATRRLGDGETGVRIPITEPGPLAAVSGSFNRMTARLEEEDERRRRLLADLGHELRTPLTVIRGEIEAVIDGVHDPAHLGNVVHEVELMERLLEDLRVLTLAEAGRLQLHREPTDLASLIDEVIASFATTVEAREVSAETRVDSEIGEIDVDPFRMRQILANLVSNALDQMPEGGSLTMSARLEGGEVVIQVADTGPGIRPDRLEAVFERFVKAGDSSGTGLGLSITRDLVEAHSGSIVAANRPEGGAVFTVRLAG